MTYYHDCIIGLKLAAYAIWWQDVSGVYRREWQQEAKTYRSRAGRIVGLREADLSLRAITSVTSRSLDTIRRVVPLPLSCIWNAEDPLRFSKRHVRLLLRTSAKGNLSAAQLKVELSLLVLVRTVKRILADVDWLVYAKMENTLPPTVADMVRAILGHAAAWRCRVRLGLHYFLGRKNEILTGPTAFSTTGKICASPSARWSDVKLEVGPSCYGPLLASLPLLCWQGGIIWMITFIQCLNIFYRLRIWIMEQILFYNLTAQAYMFHIVPASSSVKRGSRCSTDYQIHLILTPSRIYGLSLAGKCTTIEHSSSACLS